MKHKRMKQFDTEYLHVDRTGLFGMIKAMQIKPRVCTSERPPSPGRPAGQGKNPAKRKDVPPEAGKNMAHTTHQPLVPACSEHPQHRGTPPAFPHPALHRHFPAEAGRGAVLGQGTSRWQAGSPGPAVQSPAGAAAAVRWAPAQ